MGHLCRFNLNKFIEQFNTKVFFETGTSDGAGVREAQKYPFEKIYSVEIIESQAKKMAEVFKDDTRVKIIASSSVEAIASIMPTIEEPLLFFSDAHFPGADFGLTKHDSEQNDDIRMPLEKELELFKKIRAGKKDVVIIDDVILYANQGAGCWRPDIKPRQKFSSDQFYLEVLKETHNGAVIPQDQHYAILTPK